ncbi:hypothetical protein J2Y63_004708 [Shinella sp. BE166]|nr:hypothetical protein [Shinella lacus]
MATHSKVTMVNQGTTTTDGELRSTIDEKLTAFMHEMQEAGWGAEDVAFAIDVVLRERWIDRALAHRAAREELPKDFVSDGNEG